MLKTARGVVAISSGLCAAFAAIHFYRVNDMRDFVVLWWSAKAFAMGIDPYSATGPAGTLFRWEMDHPYPFTTLLMLWPLTHIEPGQAMALFLGISTAVLVWRLGSEGAPALTALLSGCYLWALHLGQWSPILTAAAVTPLLGWVLLAKPTIGLALFLYRPSRVAAIGCVLLLLLSFVVWPGWVSEWWPRARAASATDYYRSIILVPGGFLVLLALLRWRRPEALLLAALAVVPQTVLPYELLPLFLIPRRVSEGLTLAVLSWVLFVIRTYLERRSGRVGVVDYAEAAQLAVVLMYLPATIMVLGRPNEGDSVLARVVGLSWKRACRLGSGRASAPEAPKPAA